MILSQVSYLVCGLESSCTRLIARLIAANLVQDTGWDGHWQTENKHYKIVHRSLPHGDSRLYIKPKDVIQYNHVVICTRDFNCSLTYKIANHKPNKDLAFLEHAKGIHILKQIISIRPVVIINYETAYLFKYDYLGPILNNIGIKCNIKIRIANINNKYLR